MAPSIERHDQNQCGVVDGAFSRSGKSSTANAVCRDTDRHYLGSSAMVFGGIDDPAMVESLTCCEALSLAEDLQVQNLLIASGCKVVVEDINKGNLGRYGTIVAEIARRAAHFQKCSFIHEPEE